MPGGGGGGGGGGGSSAAADLSTSPLTTEWACVRAEPADGETVQALCARLQVTFAKGCGFYQLIKKESISAKKELALLRPDGSWVVGGADVRAALGLAAGGIQVAPADLPAAAELFVQSTSPNRKLSGNGAVLLRLPRSAAADALAGQLAGGGSHAAQPPPAKRARAIPAATAPAAMPRLAGLVQWSQLDGELGDLDGESIDEESLVTQAPGDQFHSMDCDEPVPEELLGDVIDWLALVMRAGSADWNQAEEVSVAVPSTHGGSWQPPLNRRFQWLSKAAGARLMYVELGDDLVLMAVEADPKLATAKEVKDRKKPWGLATGAAGSHPMIHAQRFQYANSDGSSQDMNLGAIVTPTLVMAKFIHDTAMHGANGEH